MKKEKSLKSNVILNCSRIGIDMLFPLLTFPYVSRILGPTNLGQISFSNSVVNYFVMLASLGIPSYGILICAKVRDEKEKLQKTVCELLYINFATVLISYGIFLGLLFAIPKFWQARQLFLIYSITIMVTAMGIDWLYSALEDFKYITVRSIIFKLISLALIFTLVRKQNDYLIYAAITVLSAVGSNILNLVHARKYIKLYPIRELTIKKHLKPIFALFAASIAATISANTDTVMLGFLKTDYDVGVYNFSVKIKSMLSMVMTAGLTVFVPRFSYYVRSKQTKLYRTQVRQVFILTLTVACALNVFTVFFAEPIIEILGGNAYSNAKWPVIILTSCICILACTWTLGVGVLQPLGRTSQYAKGMLCGCIVNVVMNAVLIPKVGVSGAALATMASEITIGIAYYNCAKDFLENCLHGAGFVKILAVGVIAGGCAYGASNLIETNCFLQIVLGGIVFAPLFGAGIFLGHQELREIVKSQAMAIFGKRLGKISE